MPGRIVTHLLPTGEFDLLPEVERAASLGTFVWQPTGTVQWSLGMIALLGFDPEQPIEAGQFFSRVHEDDRARVTEAFTQMVAGVDVPPVVYRIVLPDGRERQLRGHAIVKRDNEGRLVRVIGTLVDVTAQAAATRELEQTLERLADTQRWAGVGSFAFDLQTGAVEWSDEVRALLGVPPGTPSDDAERFILPEDRPRRGEWLQRIANGETPPPLYVRIVRPDGSVRHVESRGHLTKGPQGPRVVGVAIDVTARVELEEQLRHAAKMEAIGSLAAGVAHDFNNYLTAMGLQLAQVQRRGLDSPAALTPALDAIDRCANLTRQLLSFARRHPTTFKPVELTGVVRRTALLFTGLAGTITVEVVLPDEPIYVEGDDAQLESSLLNILVNAKDAVTDAGHIKVALTLEGEGSEEVARLAVSDDGAGIAAEHLPRIFEPYFTTKELGRGTGLGLAAVYGTVQQHGGTVHVESELGSGATFVLRLPTRDIPSSRYSMAPPSLRAPLPVGAQVLVVEDMEALRRVVARALRSAGATVWEAKHGREALAVLEEQPTVELVLTDVRMPIMGGVELARSLAAGAGAPALVFMTGFADVSDSNDPVMRGVPVLYKPMTEADILRLVGREITARRRRLEA